MKTFWMPVALASLVACIVLVFVLHNAKVVQKDEAIVAVDLSADLAECDRVKAALSMKVGALEIERDGLRAELKLAAEVLGVEEAEETVELTVLKDKLIEVEKRLEHAKQDRDNLANRLADVKAERDAAVEEFVRVLDRCEKLEAVIEAKDDYIQRQGGEINCLKEELARAQSCVKCHQNHSKHRRHK